MNKRIIAVATAILAVMFISSTALAGCCGGGGFFSGLSRYQAEQKSANFGSTPSCCASRSYTDTKYQPRDQSQGRPSTQLPSCCRGAGAQAGPGYPTAGAIRGTYSARPLPASNAPLPGFVRGTPAQRPARPALPACCQVSSKSTTASPSVAAKVDDVPLLSALLRSSGPKVGPRRYW